MKKYTHFQVSNRYAVIVLLTCFFALAANLGWSQQSTSQVPEKIYLQLDNKVYTKDQTIWFKAIVASAANHVPTNKSAVLYVELIDDTENVVEKKLIKLKKGIGEGSFRLYEKYDEGTYLIRAYTKWNMNFNGEFIFETYVKVFPASQKEEVNPIGNVSLVEETESKRVLQAQINPLLIDQNHAKKLQLVVSIEGAKDTLHIKKGKNDNYILNYEIPANCNYVNLHVQTKNSISYSKTFILDEEYIDLQFFPESGELVHGLTSKVGFKALDANGKGMIVEGEIINQRNEILTPFVSNALGMGYFVLPAADSAETYSARIKSKSDKKLDLLYPLPSVVSKGNVLTVVKQGEKIVLQAASNYLRNDSIYFRASCRGVEYLDIKGCLKNGQLLFTLLSKSLPEGIVAFTMMDNQDQRIAERLYFNARPESRISIDISSDKVDYTQRELTTLSLEASNFQNEAIRANMSVLVVNKKQLGEIETTRQHILSYFLLSSDLKGTIENPGFYFNDDENSYKQLDMLMITQGWRRYNYIKTVDTVVYQPETSLTISGTVAGVLDKKKKKTVHLTLMTLGDPKSFYLQETSGLGTFEFDIADDFGTKMKIILNSANEMGKKRNYSISLDEDTSPPVAFKPLATIEKVDQNIDLLRAKNAERKRVNDSFIMTEGTTMIEEVEVQGYDLSPQRQKVLKNYGKPKVVISGTEIQKKEEEWSFGLFSVLMFHYSDKVKIVTRGNNMFARVIGAPSYGPGDGVTLIVIDGIAVKEQDYPLIPHIPPSEVTSFEIIQSTKKFSQLYLEVVPDTPIMEVPRIGSVIAIYTHAGKGLHGVQKPVGLFHASVPVFSEPTEFYAPKYKNHSDTDWSKPDLRALVHWEPSMVTDRSGKASLSFYNADNLGEMMVVVEAISENGEIAYKEFIYSVQQKKR